MTTDSNASAIVWAGPLQGAAPLAPPPDSWASDPANAVAVWFVTLPQGSSLTLPAVGAGINRALYFLEGEEVSVGGQVLRGRTTCHLDASVRKYAAGAPLPGLLRFLGTKFKLTISL